MSVYFFRYLTKLKNENLNLQQQIEKLNKEILVEKDISSKLQIINLELTVANHENTSLLDDYNKTLLKLNLLNEKIATSHIELENQKKDLFDLYHNAPCGYFTVDCNGIIKSVNRTALKWIGYEDRDVIDLHTFDYYLTEKSKILYQDAFKTSFEIGRIYGLLLYAVSKSGEEMPFMLNAFALYDQNKLKLLRCTCYDMRDRLKYENEILEQKQKAEEANKSKNLFLSKMSHELRTPLHGLIGNLSILKKYTFSTDQTAIFNNIEMASQRMSVIVNDIFDMTTSLDYATHSIAEKPSLIINNPQIVRQLLNKNAKILVVDDELLNQKLLLGMLNQLNLSADTAENGKIALELYKENQYDLILMDISMPVMNGIEATKEILSTTKNNPIVIAITANLIALEKQSYSDAGILLCLPKPTRFGDFFEALVPFFEINTFIKPQKTTLEDFSNEDILDYTILNQILETAQSIGNNFDKVMLEVAKKEIPIYVAQTEEFLKKNNQKELVDMLHKLKGASWSSGMKKLGDLCKEYETKVKQNNLLIDLEALSELVEVSLIRLEDFYTNQSKTVSC